MRTSRVNIAVICAAFSGLALPHHAASPVYDDGREMTIEGVVSDFQFINPHAMITMEVADEAGNSQTCLVEMDGRLSLSRYGWSDDTVSVGDHVTVTGDPARSGACRVFFRRIFLADGSEMLSPGDDERQELEELRRQRANTNSGPN